MKIKIPLIMRLEFRNTDHTTNPKNQKKFLLSLEEPLGQI